MNLIQFQKELSHRGIDINYDIEDLENDIQTLRENVKSPLVKNSKIKD